LLTTLTLAAACNFVYRRKFLNPADPEMQIGIVPEGGYLRAEKQSVIALKWLKWVVQTERVHILHKLNGGEQQFGPYKVDGYCRSTNTIYEFHGCW
jgi:predicted phosphoribosyltransferase